MMKKQTAHKKHFPIEKIILFLAASFAAYNFGLAGGYIEHTSFSIGGLIAGIVVNITIAIAASRFGSLKGKRVNQAMVAFTGMLFISPIIVSPIIFYKLPETFLGIWQLRAVWAVAWPLVADLAIVLAGAVSGKGLIALSDESATQSKSSATEPQKVARTAKKSAAVQRTYPRKCDHCTEMIKSPNAVGAHMKKHHPEHCKPQKSLAEALFLPAEKK
jgi:hypothetical protein